jgi:hypothetical protein
MFGPLVWVPPVVAAKVLLAAVLLYLAYRPSTVGEPATASGDALIVVPPSEWSGASSPDLESQPANVLSSRVQVRLPDVRHGGVRRDFIIGAVFKQDVRARRSPASPLI